MTEKAKDNYGIMPICKECGCALTELNRDGICCWCGDY